MKNVLVVGAQSYIGDSFAFYAKDRFVIDIIGATDKQWQKIDFSKYDTLLHVAGIAHQKYSRNTDVKNLYFSVNCDLAVGVAQKAKKEGVKQFVFISSFSVYGKNTGDVGIDSVPEPREKDFYGASKYMAELAISALQNENFRAAIVRPPMVYGFGCKGNFPRLVGFVENGFIFPSINSKRSMIFIDNLSEFFCVLIESGLGGVFLPQNMEYVNISEFAKKIAEASNKKIYFTTVFNPLINMLMPFAPILQKVFGDLYYDESTKAGICKDGWQVVGLDDSIKKSVSRKN